MKLDGKTAIVTGAASGIGEGMAIRLAESGANVAICDLQSSIHEVAERIKRETEVSIHAEVVDVRNADEVFDFVNLSLIHI